MLGLGKLLCNSFKIYVYHLPKNLTNEARFTFFSSFLLFYLLLTEKPRAEIILDLHPTMEEGDELKLTCNVSEATSEVKWQKDGVSVSSRANISQIGDKSILVIKNIKTSDSGDYSCEAHNQAGFMSSTTVEINVKGKMTFFSS